MPRYVAFLRGVTPLNAKMPELRRAFEAAGFSEVRTLLSSGNVVFDAEAHAIEALQADAETAIQSALGRSFPAIVRPVERLQSLIESEPFARFDLPPGAKRVITFLRHPSPPCVVFPVERDGARILSLDGAEAFSAYLPSPKGPVFMKLLERTFGTEITTRTLDTVRKCAWA